MWAENEARRANRNLLLVNGAIAGGLILIVIMNYRYCINYLLGCEPVPAVELAGMKSADQRWRNFVKVAGSKSMNSGYREVEKTTQGGRVVSTLVTGQYVLLTVGDKILLVKAPVGNEQLEYSGELMPIPERVQASVVRPFIKHYPDVGDRMLPFTLNATDYRSNGNACLVLMTPLFLLAAWNCLKGLRRNSEPKSGPVWKALAPFGNPEEIALQIESELQQGARQQYGTLQLTARWMLQRKFFGLWAAPIGELVWIYKKVTKHSVNLIPTGKTYSIILVGQRRRTEVQLNELAVYMLLQQLAGRVPWAFFGYDKKLATAWKKDPAGMAAAVRARYQQYKSRSASAAAPGS